MSPKLSLFPILNWQEIIEQQLVKVTADTPVTKVISLMSQQHSSCVVIEEKQLQGIFTERDVVKLTASEQTIEGVAVAEVMTQQPITVSVAEKLNITELVILLSQYSIRHLPLVDLDGQTIGIVTHRSLRNALKASYLLRKKQVKEALDKKTIQETGDCFIIHIAELLADHRVSCVVIVRQKRQNTVSVGIITERDIVNFQASGLNLQQITAQEVMSTPLIPIANNKSLWDAHQLMQQQNKRRLVVINEDGTFAGIITQREILKTLDVENIYSCIETLESLLEQKNQQLETTKADLAAQVQDRTKELTIANKLLQQQINEHLSDETLLAGNRRSIEPSWLIDFSYKVTKQLKKLYQLKFPQWTGGAIAAGIAFTIELLRQSGIIVPVPFLLILLTTISSASLGGVVAGLWSTLVWSIFVIYAATVPFGSPTITGGILQVSASILVVASIAVIEGCIKEQNRRLTKIIRWVNRNLDREVHQRMEELSIVNSYLRKEIRDRLVAESKLRESEAKYRAIFEQAAVGIVRASLDKKFLAVNPKYCEMLGYSAEELSQLTFADVTYPQDKASDDRYIEQLLSGKSSVSAEKRYIRKEGSIFWVKFTANLVCDQQNQPSYFIAVIEDIDQCKKAELALEESEKRFFETVNSFPFPVWTSDEEGECNYFNQAWLEFTGRSLEQELNYGWSEGIHPEDKENCFNTYQSAFAKREKFSMEYRLKRFDGEYRWILDRGKPRFSSDGSFAGYVGACTDISDRIKAKTEREQLLRNIREKNQFLENVLQQMPAGVVIVKAPHGEIILSNQQVQDILKHPLIPIDQIADYTQYGCLDSEGKPRKLEDCTLFKVLREQKTISGEETQYLCGDGVIRTLLVNAAPILNSESETVAAIATFYDISELKQAQALKKDAQLKALILKEINHRIKNNLQIISALLDLQSEKTAIPETIKLLEESQARIQTIALIHEKLYTSANLDRIQFVDYVESLVSYLHNSFIPQNKQIEINFDLEPIELDIDFAIPCGLIINELILNAIQHGFKDRQKGEIKISFSQISQNKLCLIVKDNGVGMTEDVDFENIPSLGLNLVYSLVSTQLEGTLNMQKSQGTTFKIEFPIDRV